MFPRMPTGQVWAAGLALLLAICVSAPLAAAREVQQDGRYKLRYSGPGPCRGWYLSYKRFSTDYPAEIYMSRTADPVLWEVRTKAGTSTKFGQYTFKAYNRAASDPGYMVYNPKSCTENVTRIEEKGGAMRWRLQVVDRDTDRFRVNAALRGPMQCGNTGAGRLAPATPANATECGRGVTLLGMNTNTLEHVWVMSRVGNPLYPPLG